MNNGIMVQEGHRGGWDKMMHTIQGDVFVLHNFWFQNYYLKVNQK